MKKMLVLTLVLGIASLATAGLSISATPLGGGDYLVEAVQDLGNATGSGGVFQITINAGTTSQLYVLPKAAYDGGPPPTLFGWDWSLVGIGNVDAQQVQVTAVPNLGAGTPGLDTPTAVMDPVGGTPYTVTASLVVNGAGTATLGGEWDTVQLDQTIIIPEPATMALLGLGALVLRRKK